MKIEIKITTRALFLVCVAGNALVNATLLWTPRGSWMNVVAALLSSYAALRLKKFA